MFCRSQIRFLFKWYFRAWGEIFEVCSQSVFPYGKLWKWRIWFWDCWHFTHKHFQHKHAFEHTWFVISQSHICQMTAVRDINAQLWSPTDYLRVCGNLRMFVLDLKGCSSSLKGDLKITRWACESMRWSKKTNKESDWRAVSLFNLKPLATVNPFPNTTIISSFFTFSIWVLLWYNIELHQFLTFVSNQIRWLD